MRVPRCNSSNQTEFPSPQAPIKIYSYFSNPLLHCIILFMTSVTRNMTRMSIVVTMMAIVVGITMPSQLTTKTAPSSQLFARYKWHAVFRFCSCQPNHTTFHDPPLSSLILTPFQEHVLLPCAIRVNDWPAKWLALESVFCLNLGKVCIFLQSLLI